MPAPNHEAPRIRPEEKARRQRQRAAPDPRAFGYTLADAQAMGAPGRTKIYELINRGALKSVVIGGRRMIVGDSLRALLSA